MTRAWRSIFLAAVLYAALQVLVIAWVIPTLIRVVAHESRAARPTNRVGSSLHAPGSAASGPSRRLQEAHGAVKSMELVGSIVFLLVAAVIAGVFRLKGIDASDTTPAHYRVRAETYAARRLGVEDARVRERLWEDAEVAYFDRLYLDVPAYDGTRP